MIACPAKAGEPHMFNKVIFKSVCVYKTCGFHISLFMVRVTLCYVNS